MPTMIVNRLSSTPRTWVKLVFSAMPVTIPGSAIGRMTRNEIVSRPKKRWRATAREARVPRTSAMAVASAPASSDRMNASRAPVLSRAFPNHSSVSPGGGHFERPAR